MLTYIYISHSVAYPLLIFSMICSYLIVLSFFSSVSQNLYLVLFVCLFVCLFVYFLFDPSDLDFTKYNTTTVKP